MEIIPILIAANLHLILCRLTIFILDSWTLARTLYGRVIYGSLAWAICAAVVTYFGNFSTETVILIVSPAYLGLVGAGLWMMLQLRTKN